MFVKKFAADTLEDALKSIKTEMGPDAIILKTVTNKGLKTALNKKRIEITAAIAEKDYEKKMKVDSALPDEAKKDFYKQPASYVSNMIDQYQKNVKSGKEAKKEGMPGRLTENQLDEFLNSAYKDPLEEALKGDIQDRVQFDTPRREKKGPGKKDRAIPDMVADHNMSGEEEEFPNNLDNFLSENQGRSEKAKKDGYFLFQKELEESKEKIRELERKIEVIIANYQGDNAQGPSGLNPLRINLKTLGVEDFYISSLIEELFRELGKEELENNDVVFEHALKKMLDQIKTRSPLLLSPNKENWPSLTLLLSNGSTGQTHTLLKLANLKKNCTLIQFAKYFKEEENNFAANMMDVKIIKLNNFAEVIQQSRKAYENKNSIIIDFDVDSFDMDESKKIIEGLQRSFDNVEILLCLSSIHSELYNKKTIRKYDDLIHGLVISHLDLCVNYGAIFNLSLYAKDLPMKLFNTGPVIPDDIEIATPERILSKMFDL